MVSYIFGGDTNLTPEDIKRQRMIANALAESRTPQNVGEGVGAVMRGIAGALVNARANSAERAGRKSAMDAFNPILAALSSQSTPDVTTATPDFSTDEAADATPTKPAIKSPQDAVDASPMKPFEAPSKDVSGVEAYIREAARKRGMDPDQVVKAARSEGLAPGIWQSNVRKSGMREPSFGPFQMLLGDGKNFPKGMGNDFMNKTGLDPRDPKNVNAMVDFALDTAKREGWRQWYGPKNIGMGRWDGINRDQVASLDDTVPASAIKPATEQVPVVAVPDGFQQPDPLQAKDAAPVEVAQATTPKRARNEPSDEIVIKALMNPWLDDSQRAVAKMYYEQRINEREFQRKLEAERSDPKYKMDLEKGQIELDNLRNPKTARNLTDDEERALGLDTTGVYQEKPDKTIVTVREPSKRNTTTVDGRIVDTDTGKVVADFSEPPANWDKLDDGRLFNKSTGEIKDAGGNTVGFRFPGNSPEAAALNGLIDNGTLTEKQAMDIAAGKQLTGPNGEIIFATPQALIGGQTQQQSQNDGIDIFAGQKPQIDPAAVPVEKPAEKPADAVPVLEQSNSGMIPLTSPKVTVDERKAAGFADRMSQSGAILDDLESFAADKNTTWDQAKSDYIPLFGNYFTSEDFKKLDQAKRDFINAQLRRESGAVINPDEFDNANRQYFPQPGDTPEVIEQKRKNRMTVINSMQRDAGPTYKAPKIDLPKNNNQEDVGTPPEGVDTDLWNHMTTKERKLWQN